MSRSTLAALAVFNVIFLVAVVRGWYPVALVAMVAEIVVVVRARPPVKADDNGEPGGPGGGGPTEAGRGGAPGEEATRPLLTGTVEAAGLTWDVTEERRGGPWSQLFILKARDAGSGVMHVRPGPGQEARSLEEVEALAGTPALRYFTGPEDIRWQARIVLAAGENGGEIPLIKFISKEGAVREGPFTGIGGLGQRSDEELRHLLEGAEEV